MWFKNILIFQINQDFRQANPDLEEKLQAFAFTSCLRQEKQKIGFSPALGKHSQALVHSAEHQCLINVTKEEKILPAQVIQEAVDEKVKVIEEKEQRFLRKKEKQDLKEDVIFDLLPRAFSRRTQTQAVIFTDSNLLVVNASSYSKAEELLALLRKALGSLPVTPVEFNETISTRLTEWIKDGSAPQPFELRHEAELKEHDEEGASVRFKQQALTEDEVISHIKAGKVVDKLALDFSNSTQFVLQADGALKRLKFSPELMSEHDDLSDDPLARLDADFTLMCHELKSLMESLFPCFAGLKQA